VINLPIDLKRRLIPQWPRRHSDRFPLSLHLRPDEILLLYPADSRNAYQTLSQRYAIAAMSLGEALPAEMWESVRFILTLEHLPETSLPYLSGRRCLRLVDAGPVEVEETVRFLLGLHPSPG
jgi:hypothetical protein